MASEPSEGPIRPLGPEQAAELMAEMTRRENAQIEREEQASGDK